MREMTEAVKAYLAGIMDGEGSISLAQSGAKRTRFYIFPLVRIANTDPVLIEWIASQVGMGARQYTSAMNVRCKPCHHISWACGEAVELLTAILPYLVIKRDRAEIVISLWRQNERAKAEAGGYFGHGHPLPLALIEARVTAKREVDRLNRRGVRHPVD